MSEIQRYDGVCNEFDIEENEYGDYVLFADYQKLKERTDKLKEALKDIKDDKTTHPSARIFAERILIEHEAKHD